MREVCQAATLEEPVQLHAGRPRHLVGNGLGQLHRALLDGTVGEDDDHECQLRRQGDHLDRANGRGVVRGPHDHRGVRGEIRKQVGGPLEQLLHLPVDLFEEPADLDALGRAEHPRLGQSIDEEPVALVGRHPPGARVRLDQVAVPLQRGHVRAHRRRRDVDPRGRRDVLGSDGLRGSDVLRDHGLEDRRLAVVEVLVALGWRFVVGLVSWHGRSAGVPRSTSGSLALDCTECQAGRYRQTRSPRASSPPAASAAPAPVAQSPMRRAEMKASWGTSTRPIAFIRFLPSFWRSRSFRLRVTSPP